MTTMVRGAEKWAKPPGRLDSLHTADLYASDNVWGLPVIGNSGHLEPGLLWPYHIRTKSGKIQQQAAVHFFLDDYQFEVAWHRPRRALSKISHFAYALTPDFSLWSHWPEVLQIFNIYRSRWCGAFWMSNGVTVIPCLSWAGPESYPFAFAGIRWGSTVAISSVGVKPESIEGHRRGVEELIARVRPSNILCYGNMLVPVDIPVTEYPTYWKMRREKNGRFFVGPEQDINRLESL
jgi:hypothetical protein